MNKENFYFIGWIWSKNPLKSDHWVLDVKLRVTGRGRVGADGMVRRRIIIILTRIEYTAL
jgi:hypothetical protein